MKKLRIAQITNLQESVPPQGKNGLEQVVYDLTEELVKMGHEVTLFATADSKTSAKLIPLWPVALSRDPYGKLMSSETYSMWSVSEAFLLHWKFDVIHDHTRIVAEHFAGAIPTPVVTTAHHPVSLENEFAKQYPENYQKYFEHIRHRNRQHVHSVMVSEFQKNHFSGTCDVIYNGLPLQEWKFSEEPGEYFAFLGYMTPDKGAAEAIQAILQTKEKLVIAGSLRDDDPKGHRYYKEKILPYVDNKQITYIGVLEPEEKKEFLRKAKATLMPIQWDEPFGLVAIESMACGTPVIAWNRAAMPEIIEDGVSGYLVTSINELVKKITDVEKLSRQKTRNRVEEKFSATTMAQKYVELYRKLV